MMEIAIFGPPGDGKTSKKGDFLTEMGVSIQGGSMEAPGVHPGDFFDSGVFGSGGTWV
jgi:hypothetical protein